MVHGGDGLYREAALMLDGDDIYRPAGQSGVGWWDDRYEDVKRTAKKVQKSSAVRGLEKRALKAGADVMRSAGEAAVSGAADSALLSLGAPELAPLAGKLIDRGSKALEKKGVAYLDQKIDASGSGRVRYMSPAGGGLRLAGHGTQIGAGLRLAGSGRGGPACGCGMQTGNGLRLAGSGLRLAGNGLRLAGSGVYVQAGLVEGSGHALC